MKKIKYKTNRKCLYCNDKAIWKGRGYTHIFSCDKHKSQAVNDELKENDDYMTDADCQTWGRL